MSAAIMALRPPVAYGAGPPVFGGITDITQIYERNQEATIYVGNLDMKVDEEMLWELFVQCGAVKNVHIPRDKITAAHCSYGFVEYENEIDADYAIKILNLVKLYGKPIRCNKASQDKRTQEVGANLFIGNLDPEVDEKILCETFSAFGIILSAKVMRDPDTGESKGYGFISYDSFESSDACLAAMNSQFLCNRPIHVSYAYKKDTKGERHGCAAERLIAANKPVDKLKQNFPNANLISVASPISLPTFPNFQGLPPNLPNMPPPPMLTAFSPLPSSSVIPAVLPAVPLFTPDMPTSANRFPKTLPPPFNARAATPVIGGGVSSSPSTTVNKNGITQQYVSAIPNLPNIVSTKPLM